MATTVLGLKTFAASDPVDYNEINDNYNKIDNGVKTALQGRSAHNLLDNSYWKVQSWIVNQRGATSYTLNGYTIDRWRTYHADNTVTVNSGNLSFTNTIYQNLIGIDASKTYTLAVCDPLGNITMMTSTPESGAWKNNMRLSSESGGIVRVNIAQERSPLVWAALYEGAYTADTLPAYQPKGYAAELAECMRYYYQSNDNRSGQDGMIIRRAISIEGSTNSFSLESVDLPVTMRITPTITIYDDDGNVNVAKEWHTNDKVSNTSIRYANNRSFCVASEAGGFVGGKSYFFQYAASADL